MKPINTISASTLNDWLDTNEAILIDVREPAEYEAEYIPGAKLLPLGRIKKEDLPVYDGKKLVIHCKSGKRAETACHKLLAQDPDLDLYNLEGGISAWLHSGYLTEKSGKFFLPLDRQVQLTIGIFVVGGAILGSKVNPYFLLIPGFFGTGLIVASLTGYCGLAILMSKMPWNRGQKSVSCLIKQI